GPRGGAPAPAGGRGGPPRVGGRGPPAPGGPRGGAPPPRGPSPAGTTPEQLRALAELAEEDVARLAELEPES
ncbi:acyltransferase, partial [Streptomyces sp. NPDC059627]